MKYLMLIIFMMMPLICHADIYKSVDAKGNITFTDKEAGDNQVKVDLPDTNIVPSGSSSASTQTSDSSTVPTVESITINPAPAGNSTSANIAVNQNANKQYTKFMIISPANEETIQNQPTIPIKLDISPALQPGDVIQIYLDGAPWGNALHNTNFELPAPDRGTHVISATLFDKNMGVLMQSNSNTIYVHHAHL